MWGDTVIATRHAGSSFHIAVVTDDGGAKLSKTRNSQPLASLRESGVTASAIGKRLGFG